MRNGVPLVLMAVLIMVQGCGEDCLDYGTNAVEVVVDFPGDVSDVSVTATRDDVVFECQTDSEGERWSCGSEPGVYDVRAVLNGVEMQETVTVKEQECGRPRTQTVVFGF